MDLFYFLGKLYKNKWLILAISLLSAAAAYWFAGQQPPRYTSAATIATGVINNPNEPANSAAYIQPYRVDNTLSAIVEMLRSRVSVSLLSAELYLHDYRQAGKNFRQLPENAAKYTDSEKEQIASLLQTGKDGKNGKPEGRLGEIYEDLLKMLSYDFVALSKNLKIERVGNTDYVKVAYTSENPELSAYVVNTLSQVFTGRYNAATNAQTKNSLAYYSQLAQQKKNELTGKLESLRQYKLNNNVVDYGEQTKTTLEQIQELELKREEINQRIPSYQKAIDNFNRYLNQNDHTLTQLQAYNRQVGELKERINTLTQQYVSGGSTNKDLKSQIESLKIELEVQIKNSAVGQQSVQNSTAKKDLETEKIAAENELEKAKASLVSIDKELNRLRGNATNLVSGEADIANLERDIDSHSTEYAEILTRLNSTEFAVQSLTNPLEIVETGMVPEKAEPSKTGIITALAGISGLLLATAFVFLLAYADNSYTTPDRFTKFTGLPVLETLNEVNHNNPVSALLFARSKEKNRRFFLEAMRKLRFAVETSGAKRILVSSLHGGEGKTYVLVALAYALLKNNKKVLLIDTNFKHNSISQTLAKTGSANLQSETSDQLQQLLQLHQLQAVFPAWGRLFSEEQTGNGAEVAVLGCTSNDWSPAEAFSKSDFNAFLQHASTLYDFILMEGAALNNFADTKELTRFADKVIAVFSAKSGYKAPDAVSVDFLKQLQTIGNNKFLGAVLNMVKLSNLH
ncbi:hypothetical protein C7N43_03355 [Sphingobacteriales bacterium UPWRP_1]|nr:hypothetical protein BVG80_08755 [Sphingobacteriales bacterium TSM_CSM]PSJ78515.1 hypothetical protein C7N43_03355 [Sphingobacteriales bacterium UPWRP_1]